MALDVRQNEVEITDIPIAEITDQYLRYLDLLKELNVNLAGEFLVMAATLMEIKSRMLLPRPEADLIRQLLEYKKFKDAARQLGRRAAEQALKFRRGDAAVFGLPEREEDLSLVLGEVSVWDLASAFEAILRQTSVVSETRIALDRRPAAAYCNELLEKLRARPVAAFTELFDPREGRMALINAFVALLELIRRRRVRVEQAGDSGEIRVVLLDDRPVTDVELTEAPRPAARVVLLRREVPRSGARFPRRRPGPASSKDLTTPGGLVT